MICRLRRVSCLLAHVRETVEEHKYESKKLVKKQFIYTKCMVKKASSFDSVVYGSILISQKSIRSKKKHYKVSLKCFSF